MLEEKREYMKSNILGALDGLKKLVNLYIATYALCFISTINGLKILNKERGDDPIEILGIKAYPHYYSLIFGIMFLAFIIVLAFRINLLKVTIEKYKQHFQKQTDSELITLYPWIASPFHQSELGKVIFLLFIIFGLTNVVGPVISGLMITFHALSLYGLIPAFLMIVTFLAIGSNEKRIGLTTDPK